MIPLGIMGAATPRAGGGGGGSLYDEIMADSPWCYYQLNEAAGPSQYLDSSGNDRHLGVIVPTVTAGGAGFSGPGTSTLFDGSGGYISSGNNEFGAAAQTAFDGDTAFTMVLSIKPTILSDRVIFHIGNVSVADSQGIFAQVLVSGAMRLQFLVDGFGYRTVDSVSGAIAAGAEHIVHLRRAVGGVSSVWVDGVDVTSGSPPTLAGNIAMGATSSSDGLRIMLGALSAATPAAPYGGAGQHFAMIASAISDARIAAHAAASGL